MEFMQFTHRVRPAKLSLRATVVACNLDAMSSIWRVQRKRQSASQACWQADLLEIAQTTFDCNCRYRKRVIKTINQTLKRTIWIDIQTYNVAFSDNPSNAAEMAKMNPVMPKNIWYGIIFSRCAAFSCGNKNVTNPPIHWKFQKLLINRWKVKAMLNCQRIFSHLKHENGDCQRSHPRVQRIEIRNWRWCQHMRIIHGPSTDQHQEEYDTKQRRVR